MVRPRNPNRRPGTQEIERSLLLPRLIPGFQEATWWHWERELRLNESNRKSAGNDLKYNNRKRQAGNGDRTTADQDLSTFTVKDGDYDAGAHGHQSKRGSFFARLAATVLPEVRDFSLPPARTWRHDTNFSSLKDYRVEVEAGKHRVDALADTGDQSNFVSAQFVEKVGLIPDDRTPRRVQLPGGKQVLSPGTVKVPFSFHGELEKYLLDCWIIPGCTSDLILSGPFLRATETLTTFKHRIKESMRQIQKTCPRLNLLGNDRQRLWGWLNGRSTIALPDTGSDVMLVSAEFANENKFEIDHGPGCRLELELADGSRVFTTGVVRDATWTFGDSGQSVYCDFHVLDDLSEDVVFSNDFIFGLDVFSEYDDFIIDFGPKPDCSEFYNVRLISKYSEELTRLEEESSSDMCSPYGRKAERVRRDQIRDTIEALDAAQQNEAWEAEWKRRSIWDRHHEQHKRKADSEDTGQVLLQVKGQYSSNPKPCWWKKTFEWWSEGLIGPRRVKIPNA